jgi:putative ABC transport system permease protein
MTHDWRNGIEQLGHDLRFAVRALRQSPSFTLTAVLTTALGLGVATAICSIAMTLLLHPLPYDNAAQLVQIVEHVPADESPSGLPIVSSMMTYEAFTWRRDRARAFSSISAFATRGATLLIDQEAIRATHTQLTASTFRMLGIGAQVGRIFADGDRDVHTAVISTRLWSRYFGRAGAVIGRPIVIDDTPYTIVAVAPEWFAFPTSETDIWTPYIAKPPSPNRIDNVDVVARLRPGVTLADAVQEVNVVGNAFAGLPVPGDPDAPSPPRFDVRTLQEQLVGPVRPALRALLLAVGFILVLIGVNLASLVTARGVARRAELAVRRALGATRARLVGQMLIESLLMALMAAVAGVVIAVAGLWTIKQLAHVALPAMYGGDRALLPGLDQVRVDPAVLSGALLASIVTGMLSALLPALRSDRAASRSQVHGFTAGHPPAASWARRSVLAGQLALATMLIVGAVLLAQSFLRLAHVTLGYEPNDRLTFELVLPERGPGQRLRLANALTSQLARLPSVQVVGFTESAPLAERPGAYLLTPPGKTPADVFGSRGPQYRANMVSPDYLRAIGAHLLAGRWLDSRDARRAPRSMLINQSLATAFFGQQNPLGQTIRIGPLGWQVVGLVADIKSRGLDRDADPQAYVDPARVNEAGLAAGWAGFDVTPATLSYAVHANGDPRPLVPVVRMLVRQLDREATVDGVMAMTNVVDGALAAPRFYALLVAVFAFIAAVVAAVGLYAWLTNAVAVRTREIGVRMALGASPRAIMWTVFRDAGVVALSGLVGGLLGSPFVTVLLRQLLFGIDGTNSSVLVEVIGIVFGVALLAAYVPARWATRVDPMIAMRAETASAVGVPFRRT